MNQDEEFWKEVFLISMRNMEYMHKSSTGTITSTKDLCTIAASYADSALKELKKRRK